MHTCRIQNCGNLVVTEGLMCRPCWEESIALTRILVKNKLNRLNTDRELVKKNIRKEAFVFMGALFVLCIAVFGYLYNTGGN